MEIHQLAVVLLLVLCVALPADAQPADVMIRYKKFLNQHVFGNMNENKCDSVIYQRGITAGTNTNNCKETNTFILATQDHVRAVCQQGGRLSSHQPYKNMLLYDSTQTFLVVTCKLKKGDRRPKCEYRGKKSTRYITVGCKENWPVHYEEDSLPAF